MQSVYSTFTKAAHRVLAVLAVAAKAAMAKGGKFFSADLFTGKDAGEDQIKDGNAVKHTAGRQPQHRNRANARHRKHGAGLP